MTECFNFSHFVPPTRVPSDNVSFLPRSPCIMILLFHIKSAFSVRRNFLQPRNVAPFSRLVCLACALRSYCLAESLPGNTSPKLTAGLLGDAGSSMPPSTASCFYCKSYHTVPTSAATKFGSARVPTSLIMKTP